MKIFIADSYNSLSLLELLTGKVGRFQTKIDVNLVQTTKQIHNSDAILVPHDAYFFSEFSEYLSYLNELALRKPVIYSDRGDFPKKPRITNSIALRVAINPGEDLKNKIVVPYNIESLEELSIRTYKAQPKVSFMGFMPTISPKRIYQTLKSSPLHPISGNGAAVRKLVKFRIHQSNLDFEFIARTTYGGSQKLTNDIEVKREEYLHQISSSDFVISPRGDANQSARFYETLSAGRIPFVPITRISLPKSLSTFDHLDYPQVLFPLLKGSIDKLIEDYWCAVSNQVNYLRHQIGVREFFNRNLAFNTFMKRLFRLHIEDFIKLSEFDTPYDFTR